MSVYLGRDLEGSTYRVADLGYMASCYTSHSFGLWNMIRSIPLYREALIS